MFVFLEDTKQAYYYILNYHSMNGSSDSVNGDL